MTTAESIITNYIDQGYSVEALRLVAEARPQPLRGELLAILDAMEVEAEPVDCVAGEMEQGDDTHLSDSEENIVFCVADDVSASDEDPAFDLMAATIPPVDEEMADAEESVADVMVLTNGEAHAVAHDKPGSDSAGEAGEDGFGVWSRAWQGSEPENVSAELDGDGPGIGEIRDEEIVAEDVLEGIEEGDWLASGIPDVPPDAQTDDAVDGASPSAAAMPEDAEVPGEEPAASAISDENASEEIPAPEGAGYLPVVKAEQARLLQAQTLLAGENRNAHEESPGEAVGRKERRRRQRAEKKKGKRNKKSTSALPEIVLTKGADDQVMVPESCETVHADEEVHAETGFAEEAVPAEAEINEVVMAAVPMHDAGSGEESETASVAAEEDADIACCAQDDAAAEAVYADMDDPHAAGDDHVMILASGGLDLGALERFGGMHFRLDDGIDDSDGAEEEGDGNIIIFGEKFPMFAGFVSHEDDAYLDEGDVEEYYPPVLRMLPPVEEAVSDSDMDVAETEAVGEEVESIVATGEAEHQEIAASLRSEERVLLLRSLIGATSVDEIADGDGMPERHVIVSWTPETEEAEALEREAMVRTEVEQEYQARMDEFAHRLLEAQAGIARSESKVQEKQAEIAARETILKDLQSRLGEEEKKRGDLVSRLDEARRETGARQAELDRLSGMLDEHERLYGEYEDLRKAYNEVVSDVMPGLQGERDELALTVERQIVHEKKMRSSLTSAKRRLAAGYVLSAAACMMLVAMPVANWLRAGRDAQELAMEHQRVSELSEQLDREEMRNVEALSTIADLEQRVQRYSTELANVQSRNQELARMSQQHSQGIAVFQPEDYGRDGRPTRTSDMALQGTSQPGGPLRRNDVRDPAGSIESTLAYNQNRAGERNGPQMAQNNRRPDIPVSAVAQTRPARQSGGSQPAAPASALRPGGNAAPAGGRTATAAVAATTRPASGESVKATVKKGEGVAQVVYRVLGTWDPEVVAWVIRENKIQTNTRGNPIIQPGQELRLPKEGRIGQTASAARAR